jgi:GNAT superfamily N-acetyltransferase
MQWLHIDILWIDEICRGKGVGTKIIRMAESEALNKGCTGIYFDTFNFQAKGFYKKLGYALFGHIDDFPPGHQRYFFQKKIGPGFNLFSFPPSILLIRG